MNDKILKNQRAWRRLLLLSALPVLLFSSCNEEQELSQQEITLTRPVIKLGGMEASASRAAGALNLVDLASWGNLRLSMHDEEREIVVGENFGYDSEGWYTYGNGVTITGGPGTYRAGIEGYVDLKADEVAGIPVIMSTRYAYRGTIEVKADGSFTPGDALQPYSTAVQWVLKDANGADIATQDGSYYLIRPVGFARMLGFTKGADGYAFPNGTSDAVLEVSSCGSFQYTPVAYGYYAPGTYPTTWPEGKLQTTAAPSAPWPLAEVSNGGTTWTVSYPPQQLTLEAGNLYTFTIGLSKDAHITLGADDISIAPWGEGTPIHVGR